jgi:hypothetical protein
METGQESELDMKIEVDGFSIDWYLQSLVSIVNSASTEGTEIEISLTLVVGGSLVSGMLISGKKYFDIFADEFSAAWPGEKSSIRESFASNGKIYEKDDESEGKSKPLPQFIHMRNARVYNGGSPFPQKQGVLWRGKINAVSGFNLGSVLPE